MRAPLAPLRRLIAPALLLAALVALAAPAAASAGASERGEKLRLTDYFTSGEIERSRRYTGPRYALGFAALGIGVAAAAVLGLGGASRALGGWAERVTGGRWPLTTLVLAVIVTLVPSLVTLPLTITRGLFHERKFGLSTQSATGYLADFGKANGVAVVVTAAAALGFFFIVRRLPRGWPAAAAAFAVALTVVMVVVYPLVYEPLFNRFTPVDAATRERIVALAAKAGVRVDQVLVADASRRTTKQNAYVSGLGATKRVVLYDTLLKGSTPEQVDLVVAHELGHVVHRDVLRGTILGGAGAVALVVLVGFLLGSGAIRRFVGVAGPGDPRALPFLAFVVALTSVLSLPVANGFSRQIEAAADRFAVRLTGDAQTAVAVEVNLARENVADLTPNAFVVWMFYSHPPVMERIRIALQEGAVQQT